MFFVAAVLAAILSGLFYAADRHEIGSLGVAMCQYGSPFCDNPFRVLRRGAGWLRGSGSALTLAAWRADALESVDPRISVTMPLCR